MNQPSAPNNGSTNSIPKSKRGGARPGAGRPRGSASIRNPQSAIRNYSSAFPGAEPYQPGRTYIYYPLVDPRRELTAQSRIELLKKARFLYNAVGLAKRAIDGPARNAVGSGLCPKWMSDDEDWNREMAERFENGPGRDPRAFDAAGRVNFYDSQSLTLIQAALDGDFFAQPLRATDGSIRCRFIEGTFVGNSGKIARGFDENLWFDGVRTNTLGLPIAYRVLKDPVSSDQFTDVPAEDIWHICRRDRHGYVRGASALATACNHLHDLMDIGAFLKHSYKIAAQFPFTIITERNSVSLGSGLTGETDATTGQTEKTMRMRSESGVPVLQPGEKIESNNITIPGETFDPFSNYLIRDVAWGRGLSPEVLWNITTTGGANNRYVAVEAQRFYEGEQDLFIYSLGIPYIRAWTFAEIESGRASFAKGWDKIGFNRPAKLTVDNGRDGKLLMEQMAAGFLNPDECHAMQGRDGAEMDRQAIRVAIRRKQMVEEEAAAAGVELDPAEVFQASTQGGAAPPQESGAGSQEPDEEYAPPKPGQRAPANGEDEE